MTDHQTCHCADLRELVSASLHGVEAPPCPVHNPASQVAQGADFALNDDAAIFAALGATPNQPDTL